MRLVRRALCYPPFRASLISFSAKKQSLVESLYPKIKGFNATLSDLDVQPIGPKVAPIEKLVVIIAITYFIK